MSESDFQTAEPRHLAPAFHQSELFATLIVTATYTAILLVIFFSYVA